MSSRERHIHTAALDRECLACRERDERIAELEAAEALLLEAVVKMRSNGIGWESKYDPYHWIEDAK